MNAHKLSPHELAWERSDCAPVVHCRVEDDDLPPSQWSPLLFAVWNPPAFFMRRRARKRDHAH